MTVRPRVQHAHVTEQQLGGTRRTRLRVVQERPLFEPKTGLPPGGRAECKNGERPCPYVRCKWHLWLVEGRDRQGRRYAEGAGHSPATTLEPRWLEWPTPPCCALDVAERVVALDPSDTEGLQKTLNLLERATGRGYFTLRRIVRAGLAKMRDEVIEATR